MRPHRFDDQTGPRKRSSIFPRHRQTTASVPPHTAISSAGAWPPTWEIRAQSSRSGSGEALTTCGVCQNIGSSHDVLMVCVPGSPGCRQSTHRRGQVFQKQKTNFVTKKNTTYVCTRHERRSP